MTSRKRAAVDPVALDLGYLSLFVGMRINELVLERLHRAGYDKIRHAHGYVFQHLLGGPRTVTELARLLEVSQQAASKTVAELANLGYVDDATSPDRRARRVVLSAKGHACIARSRAIRVELEQRLIARHDASDVAATRKLLTQVLDQLGGLDAVRQRRVRAPR